MPAIELLRFLSAGSVDDGKSTLIGRLLHDTGSIYQDQFASLQKASPMNGNGGIDFSLVTDGLRAEREQGITIDVAYRYFATARRKFIIADSPGHEQYTRNMATAASTANLAVLLMDARKGLLPQTCRHAAIAWLLGIRSFIVAINKMDLVEFREEVFRDIAGQFTGFVSKLGSPRLHFVPTCSLSGDNVVTRSARTPWFDGPTLLEHLETAPIVGNGVPRGLRFPVQSVLRSATSSPLSSRRYAGQIASGIMRPGDLVTALPSGRTTRITSIRVGDQEMESATPPLSVSVALETELDIGRGDMLASPDSLPQVTRRLPAILLWMSELPMKPGSPYLIKHTTRFVCGSIARLIAVIDPTTLERRPAKTLGMNEFGHVEIETHQPLYSDPYGENRVTGAFIVVDPISNETQAAGMIEPESGRQNGSVIGEETGRSQGLTVWFTGLSSAGKSSIGQAVYEKLWARGHKVEWLDGDIVRQHLSKGLGYDKKDRDENIRRIGFVAELLTRNGVIVIVSAISPYRAVREEVRKRTGNFLEVYVSAPLAVCEQRDLKGIYRRARAGEIHGVTGVDDPYEPPLAPEVECHTDSETLAESTARVLRRVEEWLLARTAQSS
ncbi:MAG TPA: adenylyl-sulfate kinase [Candidatus Saccharimonadales bacterium]|nr:adenylyl-sulfate kinase [Candidatus Saccharimonadales bacterium]